MVCCSAKFVTFFTMTLIEIIFHGLDKIQEYEEGDLRSSYFWLYIGEQIMTQLEYGVDIPIYQSLSFLNQ